MSELTVGSYTCRVAFCGIFVLFFRCGKKKGSVVSMKVMEKEMITIRAKMLIMTEDFINGFEKLWLYAGNDERRKYIK